MEIARISVTPLRDIFLNPPPGIRATIPQHNMSRTWRHTMTPESPDTARTLIDGMPFLLVKLHEATFHAKDVIYVILDIETDGAPRILDVDQSPEYGAPPIDHTDRRACWLSHASTPDLY